MLNDKIKLYTINKFIIRNRFVLITSISSVFLLFIGSLLLFHFYENTVQNYNVFMPEGTEDMDWMDDFGWADIFKHNFIVLSPILLGVLSLGFLSFFYLSLQMLLLGSTIYDSLQVLPLVEVLKYTVFHGVFEFSAFTFAIAFAIKPSIVLFNCIVFKKPFLKKIDLKDMTILFLLYVLFLFVGALVEEFITGRI